MVPKVLGSYCYTERIKEILNKKHSPSYHVLHHSVVVSLAVRHHQLRTSHVPQLITVMHQHQNNQGRPWSFHNPSKLRSGIAQETKTRSNFENSFFVCVHFNGQKFFFTSDSGYGRSRKFQTQKLWCLKKSQTERETLKHAYKCAPQKFPQSARTSQLGKDTENKRSPN